MNIFDFAQKMELDGKRYYEQLAGESNNPGLRTIFLRLAADEQKHFETLQALRNERERTVHMEDSTVLDFARNVFESLLSGQRPPALEGDLEGYRHAMKLEADSVNLYEEAARREENREVKAVLERIAEEEQKHFKVLENIYDFVNAPNEYLAWREFTNHGEFRQFGRDIDM